MRTTISSSTLRFNELSVVSFPADRAGIVEVVCFGHAPPFIAYDKMPSEKPSAACGECPHSLTCVLGGVAAFECHKCRKLGLWSKPREVWVWPDKEDCPMRQHAFKNVPCDECHTMIAALDALKKCGTEKKERPAYTITTTGSNSASYGLNDPYAGSTASSTGSITATYTADKDRK